MMESPWLYAAVVAVVFLVREIWWRIRLRRHTKKAVEERLQRSRAVLKGQIGEQMAPLLPDFPYEPGDVRFVGGVIDLIIFRGAHAGNIEEVVLADVKSGHARLSAAQRQVAQAVEEGRVRFETIRLQ